MLLADCTVPEECHSKSWMQFNSVAVFFVMYVEACEE